MCRTIAYKSQKILLNFSLMFMIIIFLSHKFQRNVLTNPRKYSLTIFFKVKEWLNIFNPFIQDSLDQWQSMSIKNLALIQNSSQCRSMPIDSNQYRSIPINADRCWSIGIERNWSAMIGIDQHWAMIEGVLFIKYKNWKFCSGDHKLKVCIFSYLAKTLWNIFLLWKHLFLEIVSFVENV